MYYFVALEGIFSKFEINEEWVDYLIRNRTILLEWVRYNLIGYLQDRNPNVPGIVEKVQKPEKRDLRRVSDYWKTIIEIDPKIKEIYQKVSLKDKPISIDHFVPWQYLSHDELWNLTPASKPTNTSKNNRLPDRRFLRSFVEYNYYLYGLLFDNSNNDVALQLMELFNKCENQHLNAAWATEKLYIPGNSKEQFENILEENLGMVYDSAKLQEYEMWEI